jgi:PAS domain S-box-containing protein
MFHPEDRAEVRFSFESAIALRRPYEFQARILRPGDEIRHVLCRGLCEVDAATDHLRAVFGTVMDVTDVTLSERRLAEKSSNLEATLENIDQGLLKVASDGTIELSNRRYSDLLDVPAGLIEGAGRQWRDVLDHLDRRGEFANLDATGLRRHQEARLAPGTFERVRPDGRIVEVRIARLPDGSSVLTYADITGRRQAEIAMQQSETRYRVLADSTSDVITQLDLEFKRQYVSPACRTVFGYAPEEMLGLRPSATIHPDDAVEVRALARRLAAGKLPDDRAVTTYRALHKRGHYVWIEASMSLVRDGITGAPTSLICSLRDVTERQRAARHLQRAKAAAEQAARVKADFLANMSHELRTPLTGMLGVHDLLRNQPGLNDAQRRLLGLASDSGRALLTIVNDILDFSKIEAGQLEIESVPFSLHGVVDSCLALAAEGLQGKPISIETTYRPPHIDGFVGDPTRLRQILLNLLTNAVKFTERGRIGIDVLHQADKRLRIEVTDTGIGVPAEKISALFERFGQADSSVNRRYGGTGLGLAICKGLLGLMGGTIGFEARPQGGSTFWFELPLAQHDDPEAPAVCAEALRPAGARRRILLAEDNAINGEIIATMLSGRGHDVAVVADGQAAVQAAQSGIDVILMDLQMPVMDGLTATTLIRANERASQRPRTPIVGLTANAMAEDVERCVRAGMDAHVAKPIDWPTLFATLDRLLAGPGREPAAAQNDEEDPAVVVLDETILATLSDLIGRGRIASILARFVADLEARIADLKGAAATVAQVHSLASIAGQLGFLQLHQLCMMIEQEARDGVSRDHSAMLREVAGRAARAAAASDFAHAPS